MDPLFVIAVPIVFITLGVILNRNSVSFDNLGSSPEQDLAQRLARRRESFRQSFNRQRSLAMTWQKPVGGSDWLPRAARHGSLHVFPFRTVVDRCCVRPLIISSAYRA